MGLVLQTRSTDSWALDDRREYLALLERRKRINDNREEEERKARAAVDHAAMMEEARFAADDVRDRCKSFDEFVREAWKIIEPGTVLKWNWHLDAMCAHLEAISRGTLHPRLIINVPPGSSKSTIVTVLWQAYEWGPLGKRSHRYVTTSFELTNVLRDNRKSRDLIQSDWFQELWPEVELATTGVKSFSNIDTGTRLGVAFKAIMGKRGDRLIVDDPHSLDQAESEVERKKHIRLFIEGGLNRTNDAMTSAIVIVMQRVHEQDLTGALLAKDFGFIHLMIPMEFEADRRCVTPLQVPDEDGELHDWTDPRVKDGDLMDKERVPPEAIRLIKLSGDYAWAGQYQQRPAPREGGMFKVDKIEIVEFAPWGGRAVRGWDLAASTSRNSAFTAGVAMRRIGGYIYVLDVRRDRLDPAQLRTFIKAVADEDEKDWGNVLQSLPQDPGAAGKVQKHDLGEVLFGLNVHITTEQGKKEQRAEPYAAQVGLGKVKLVKGAWNQAYIDELRTFPAGTFKDQVDASSRAFGELLTEADEIDNEGPELLGGPDSSGRETVAVTSGGGVADAWL